ncbi:hypothetical protein [Polyangium mundeleinium]|uniref:Uncharacterized protein n=1 Tax=Polyangium mundeleinium TaxID=2995306 RepID=A0ABT5EXE0_9BACT|nr:hypothetical protein [Polyangium mundeleinium]MDC0745466.1 hypothetical protein [Polyangium mundeleinium]
MIYIAIINEDALVKFRATMSSWLKTVEQQGSKDGMTAAWLSNWKGLNTAIEKRTKQDLLVSVFHTSGTVYMLGKVRFNGSTMDVSEVVGNPTKVSDAKILDERDDLEFFEWLRTNEKESLRQMYRRRVNMRPLGSLFSWAAENAQRVTLTANTVGLIGYYSAFGFELDPEAPSQAALRALATIEKYAALIAYLDGIEKGTGVVDEAKAGRLGEMFESKQEPAETIAEASKGRVGAGKLRQKLEGMIKDQKFGQVDAAMVLGIGRFLLVTTYIKGVQWKTVDV